MLSSLPRLTMNQENQWILDDPALLVGSHALERECLRVTPDARLSGKPHPKSLGHPLTHSEISTDFAECQLELITDQYGGPKEAIEHLRRIHAFLYRNLEEELLWPLSAPCCLPQDEHLIPLAYYGESTLAKEKRLYRKGLASRYGRRMQTLSGVHYNFSLGDPFFAMLEKGADTRDLRSKVYLHITRNFLRSAWIPTLLFGMTPAFDKSYLPGGHPLLESLDQNTWYTPNATSLRLSEVGYTSSEQAKLAMSYDSIEAFVRDLRSALSTPSKRYELIGKDQQINDRELQIEAEHYEAIRPKPRTVSGRRPAESLEKDGIAYLEVRCVDLNPIEPNGVSEEQLRFLHLLLLDSLRKASPSISQKERWVNFVNQNQVALYGRDDCLQITTPDGKRKAKDVALECIEGMQPIAEKLDSVTGSGYLQTLDQQRQKLSKLLPSEGLLEAIREKGLIPFGLSLAEQWAKWHRNTPFSQKEQQYFSEKAKQSLQDS